MCLTAIQLKKDYGKIEDKSVTQKASQIKKWKICKRS